LLGPCHGLSEQLLGGATIAILGQRERTESAFDLAVPIFFARLVDVL